MSINVRVFLYNYGNFSVITAYNYGILHSNDSINGVSSVLVTGKGTKLYPAICPFVFFLVGARVFFGGMIICGSGLVKLWTLGKTNTLLSLFAVFVAIHKT